MKRCPMAQPPRGSDEGLNQSPHAPVMLLCPGETRPTRPNFSITQRHETRWERPQGGTINLVKA